MNMRSGVHAMLSAAFVAGCSTHPLPEDFAPLDTYGIVRQIRCEARGALEQVIIKWMTNTKVRKAFWNVHPDIEKAEQALARSLSTKETESGPLKDLVSEPKKPLTLADLKFPGLDQVEIDRFKLSGVAYNFTFDMTETNNFDTVLDILGILRHTSLTAALNSGFDRTRDNLRTFNMTETFTDLLNMKTPEKYCENYITVHNAAYPITGTIGLSEVFKTFIELSSFSPLSPLNDKGTPAMSDAIAFTTKLSGSLAPKVTLAPAFRGAQLADAQLTVEASRMDIHKLIIGISEPPPEKAPEARATSATRTGKEIATATPGVTVLDDTFLTVSGTPAELSAARAVNQTIFRFEFGRLGASAALAFQ